MTMAGTDVIWLRRFWVVRWLQSCTDNRLVGLKFVRLNPERWKQSNSLSIPCSSELKETPFVFMTSQDLDGTQGEWNHLACDSSDP